jgi:hypothetical protein
MILFNEVVEDKTQGDGAFTVLLEKADNLCRHQVQVEVSATPAAGTLAVSVRSPGAVNFVELDGTFDLTGTALLKVFGPVFAAEMRFTPSGFDAGKTYNVIINSGVDG